MVTDGEKPAESNYGDGSDDKQPAAGHVTAELDTADLPVSEGVIRDKVNWTMPTVIVICFFVSTSIGSVIGYNAIFMPQFAGEREVTKIEDSVMASIVNIGQLLGSPLSGLLANVWGRKKAILLTNTVSGLGWVIVAASFSDVAAISVGRFLSGFGIVTSVIQIYICEVSPIQRRGLYCAMGPLGISCGILFVYVLGWGLYWKWVACAIAVTTFVNSALILAFMPESPAWLFMRALSLLRNVHEAVVEPEIKNLEAAAATQHKKAKQDESLGPALTFTLGVWHKLPAASLVKATSLVLVIQFLVQFSGANAITANAVSMASQVGFGIEQAALPAIGIAGLRIGGSLLSLVVLKVFKRKTAMLATAGVMFASLAAASAILFFQPELNETFVSLATMSLAGLYLIAFAAGAGAVPWFLAGEIIPVKHRSLVSGLSISVACLSIFVSLFSYAHLVAAVDLWGVFSLYAATTLLVIGVVALFLPETKGISEADIETLFEN